MQLSAVVINDLIAVIPSRSSVSLLRCVQVDFPVHPGDRLLLKVAEVDVRTGFYRLYVVDKLSTYNSSPEPEEADAEESEETADDEDLSEEALERLVLLDFAGEAAAGTDVCISSDESDEPQGVLRWRTASPPSSSSSSDIGDSEEAGLVFGSFTSSDVGSEILGFDRQGVREGGTNNHREELTIA